MEKKGGREEPSRDPSFYISFETFYLTALSTKMYISIFIAIQL